MNEPDQKSLVSFGVDGQSNLNDHGEKGYKNVSGREVVPEKAYEDGLRLAGVHKDWLLWIDAMKELGHERHDAEAVFEALLWDGKIYEPILGKIEVIE